MAPPKNPINAARLNERYKPIESKIVEIMANHCQKRPWLLSNERDILTGINKEVMAP